MRTREEIAKHVRLLFEDLPFETRAEMTLEEIRFEVLLDIRDELGAIRQAVNAVEGAVDGLPMDRR